jgi:hypothetical protein
MSGYKLVNKAGITINIQTSVTYEKPTCDWNKVKDLIDFASTLSSNTKGVNNLEQASALINLVNNIPSKYAMQGCMSFINSLVSFKATNVTLPGQSKCMTPYSDPSWATDPCCNRMYFD